MAGMSVRLCDCDRDDPVIRKQGRLPLGAGCVGCTLVCISSIELHVRPCITETMGSVELEKTWKIENWPLLTHHRPNQPKTVELLSMRATCDSYLSKLRTARVHNIRKKHRTRNLSTRKGNTVKVRPSPTLKSLSERKIYFKRPQPYHEKEKLQILRKENLQGRS